MQIVPFLTHYQLVYANFDFSSFSLISCTTTNNLLHCEKALVAKDITQICLHLLHLSEIMFIFATIY